jgi:hypothetical protein
MTEHEIQISQMSDPEHPFKFLQHNTGVDWDRMEVINVEKPDEEAQYSVQQRQLLNQIGLSEYSTAGEVREKAMSLREAAQENTSIVTINTLKWVLGITKNCKDDEEFNAFFLRNSTFKEISESRNLPLHTL